MHNTLTELEIAEALIRKEIIKRLRHVLSCYNCVKHITNEELQEILNKLENV